MKHISSLFFLLLGLTVSLSAQSEIPTMKWGDLEDGDIEMTVYEKDSEASALVLGDLGHIIVELEDGEVHYRYQRHRRVKILKPEGIEKAALDVAYITEKPYQEQLVYFQSNYYTEDGKRQSISKGNVVKAERGVVATRTFQLPQDLKVGDIVEYRYEILSPRIDALREWYFQESLPVKFNQLRIEIPSAFKYFYLIQGKIPINYTPLNDKAISLAGRVTKVKNDIYYVENVPAFVSEPYISTPDDYRARLKFQLEEVKHSKYDFDVITSFDEINEKLQAFRWFGPQYTDENEFSYFVNEITRSILESNSSETAKAEQLYNYIANTIAWNGLYSFITNESLNEVFENKQGNSASLNLALLALLKKAGIQAEPVLISTRDNGKVRDNNPMVDQFNHVLLQASLDGEKVLLDVEPSKSMSYPRANSLNGKGCLLRTPIEWIDITAPSTSTLLLAKLDIKKDGSLSGYLQGKYKGYDAVAIREELAENNTKTPARWQELGSAVSFSNKQVKNIDNLNTSLHIASDVDIKGLVRQENGDLHFKPVFTTNYAENPFQQTNRRTPVQLDYPIEEVLIAHYTIPEGYEVKALPTPIGLALPDNHVNFNLNIDVIDKQIQLIYKLRITNTTFDVVDYETLSMLFKQLSQKLQQEIVLTPIK